MRDKSFRHAPQTEMQGEVDMAAAESQREGGESVVPEQAGLFYDEERGSVEDEEV